MNELRSTAGVGARPTWVRWHIVFLLVALSFMSWFNRVSMSVAYDEAIKEQTGISERDMGVVYSILLFSYMVCMTPGGWIIDRFGPRVALLLMGFGMGLFGLLTSLAGLPMIVAAGLVWPALLVIRFVMGIFAAPMYPGSSRMISLWVPGRQRALANGFVQAAAAAGIAFTFPIFGELVDRFEWPMAFVISGGFTMFLALVWMIFVTDHPGQHFAVNNAELEYIRADRPAAALQAAGAGTAWVHLLRNRSLVCLTISYAAIGYIEYLFFFWMHFYFKEVLRLGTEESRVYAMILNLSLGVGMIAGGWAADRVQSLYPSGRCRPLVPMFGMVLGALCLEAGLFLEDTASIVACLSLALAFIGACEATVWTTAIDLGGRFGATAAAIANTGGNAGGLLAPILTPWIAHMIMREFYVGEQEGWFWGITVGSCICLAGASLWLWIRHESR